MGLPSLLIPEHAIAPKMSPVLLSGRSPSSSPSPWRPLALFLSPWSCLFRTFYINAVTRHVALRVRRLAERRVLEARPRRGEGPRLAAPRGGVMSPARAGRLVCARSSPDSRSGQSHVSAAVNIQAKFLFECLFPPRPRQRPPRSFSF